MIIVSNTTPIISLLKVNKLQIFEQLWGEIIIPEAVFDEATTKQSFEEEANTVKNSMFIKTMDIKSEFSVKLMQKQLGLDLGESEAIVLAEELNADMLIMDERKGRKIAKDMGIPIAGTLGILLLCKRKGIIEKIKPILDELINNDIRIGKHLYKNILKSANENQ